MEPHLARFETEQPNVSYVHVNVDERDSGVNKEYYDKYFQGDSIPYTVLIGKDKKSYGTWGGMVPYDRLVSEIAVAAEKSR